MARRICKTIEPHVLASPSGRAARHRVPRLRLVLAGAMALGVTVGVTLAQELPSPGGSKPLPQPQGMGPVVSDDPLDLQARQLEARREKLAYTAQEIDQQMRQSALEQEQRRRRLQQDLNETQEQLREVDRQLADLPRQRRRAQYLAALQALEQASRSEEHTSELQSP